MISRRAFLGQVATTAGAVQLGGVAQAFGSWPGVGPQDPPARPLRILILGGTGYIGPYQIRYALSRGHQITIFNRGRTPPVLFPEIFDRVERLIGDRNSDLEALRGREWDVVIDNSGRQPAQVQASAELLRDAVGRYLFVSTLSAYADRSIIDQDESGVIGITGTLEERQGYGGSYGLLKAQCEEAALEVFGDRLTLPRPGAIVGPGDPIDLFTYWLLRIDRGGEMLTPSPADNPFQVIDVRDATEFMIRLVERDLGGAYNVTGPAEPLTWGRVFETMREATGSDVRFTWIDADFLLAQDVDPFTELPLWMPHRGPTAGFHRFSAAKARAAGLTYRPLTVTVSDLLAWCREQPPERWANLRTGLSPEREREVLDAWHQRSAGA